MPFNLDFTDKVVLVTGSSSGIGESTVLLFAELGAKVVVHGRDRERVADVAQKCRNVSPKKYQVYINKYLKQTIYRNLIIMLGTRSGG